MNGPMNDFKTNRVNFFTLYLPEIEGSARYKIDF
jgi:hypothetical protein